MDGFLESTWGFTGLNSHCSWHCGYEYFQLRAYLSGLQQFIANLLHLLVPSIRLLSIATRPVDDNFSNLGLMQSIRHLLGHCRRCSHNTSHFSQ